MKNQRKRQYDDEIFNRAAEGLKSYRDLMREIKYLQDKAIEYRDRCIDLQAVNLENIRVMGGERYDKAVELALRWIDLSQSAEKKSQEAERKLWFIRGTLDNMESGSRKILELYYIDGYTLEAVSDKLDYSIRQVVRLKRAALDEYSQKMALNVT